MNKYNIQIFFTIYKNRCHSIDMNFCLHTYFLYMGGMQTKADTGCSKLIRKLNVTK